ncbi:MAG: sugar phosphate isomerase/epimerase [Chlorobiales bacterium]|nr:sugar phosphate isomerase/epimerase [Chlorobiales bacterium]
MSCKKKFPFRVGTTSYIIPDEIVPNIEYLKDKVDDVELVLFESDEMGNLPSAQDIARLQEISEEYDLTYSIHLPLDVYLGSADAAIRKRSVDKCHRVVELTEALHPSAYVMHAEAGPGIDVNGFSNGEKNGFAENFHISLERFFSGIPVQPSEFCVETLNYPFEILGGVISSFGLSVTLDIGHLELYGHPVNEHLDRYLEHTRVLHMHGIKEGKDHKGLQYMRAETLDMVMQALSGNHDQKRVVTMEIFSEDDFNASCAELIKYGS